MDYSGFPYGPSKVPGGLVGRGGSVPRSVIKFQERQSTSPHATAASGYSGSPTHVSGRMRGTRGTLEDVAAANAALQYSALVHSGGLVDASVPKRSQWQTSYAVDGYGGNPHMERLAATEESVPTTASAIYSHYGLTQGDGRGYITSGNAFYHPGTQGQAYLEAASGKPVPQTREDFQNLYKVQGYAATTAAAAAALYPPGYAEGLALASGTLEGYDARAAYNAYTSAVNGAISKEHLQGATRPPVDERYSVVGYGGIPSYTQPRETYPGVASSYATPRRGGPVARRF